MISDKIAWVSFTTAWSLIWARPEPQDWAWHNGWRPRGCGGTRPWPLRSGESTPAAWPGPSSPRPIRPGSGFSRPILTRSVNSTSPIFFRHTFYVILTKISGLIFGWIRLGPLLISEVISLILSITLAGRWWLALVTNDWRSGPPRLARPEPQWFLGEINHSPGPGQRSVSSQRWWGEDMDTILQGEYGPPLDYSFRNISSLSSLPSRFPRQSLRKQRRSPSGRLEFLKYFTQANYAQLLGTIATWSVCPTTTLWIPRACTNWHWTWLRFLRTLPGWISALMTSTRSRMTSSSESLTCGKFHDMHMNWILIKIDGR